MISIDIVRAAGRAFLYAHVKSFTCYVKSFTCHVKTFTHQPTNNVKP